MIAAPLGFLLWLFSRRTKTVVDEERPADPLAADVIANESDAGILERSPECQSKDDLLEHEDSAKHIHGRMEEEQPEALQAAACVQSQSVESNFPGESAGAETVAAGLTGQSEELSSSSSTAVSLPSSIEIFPGHERPAMEAGIAGISADYSAEGPVAVAATATTTFSDGLHRESALPETPAPEVAVVRIEVMTEATPEIELEELPEQSRSRESTLPETPAPEAAEVQIEVLTEEIPGAESEELPEQARLVERETERTPQRYRPPPQKPPRPTTARPAVQELQRAGPPEVSRDIRVRLTFDRFGFCAIALLPERTSDLDDEVAVKLGGKPLLLVAQEDWYQDLPVENIGSYLRQGVELRGVLKDDRGARWLLTGRDLYVLASHQRASGFVSTNRLALGRSHVVLCGAELLHELESILNVAGCEGYTRLDESHGVPSGWVGLRGVTPTIAISLNSGSDPFYAVKPAPDIEIDLEGGVCLRNSVWLAGYPPRIRLLGESSAAVRVLIDDKEAQPTAEGFFTVDGYDTSGRHSVYCEGLSCSSSYSIEEPPDSWEEWPAHHFAQADICGPLVQPAPETVNARLFTGPMSNPLLLGAEPGQVFRCSPRSVALWKGFVPFDVVWALPAQPLQCNKKTARILQFADAPVAPLKPGSKPGLGWSNAILDASRKGLRIENGSPDSIGRWSDYKKTARNIWRAAR